MYFAQLDIFYQITYLFETSRAVINSLTNICIGNKDVMKLDRNGGTWNGR